MIQLPEQNKSFSTNTQSTVLGNLLGTFNLDPQSNRGKIRVSGRGLLNVNESSTNCSSLLVTAAFANFTDNSGFKRYWALGGTKVFRGSISPNIAFAEDPTSGSPITVDVTKNDMKVWNDNLWVTTTQDSGKVYYTSGGSWSNFVPQGNTSEVRMLCGFNNRMYMSTASSKIISWDTSRTTATSGANTIQLAAIGEDSGGSNSRVITKMVVAQNRIFVFTVNSTGGPAHAYIWDGVSDITVDRDIKLQSMGILSAVVLDDTPYVIDTRGYLMRYNGASFEEIDRLPLFNREAYGLQNVISNQNDRFIHPNGMTISRNKVNFLVLTSLYNSSLTQSQYTCDGIWEYDRDIGIYHRISASYLNESVGTVSDYGQIKLAGAGALMWATSYSSANDTNNGSLLFGAKYYTNATSTKYGIFYNDITQDNSGSFTATASFVGADRFYAGANSTNVSGNSGWIFTAPPTVNTIGETSLTLTSAWIYTSGTYKITFSSGEVRFGTFTYGSTTVTWTNPLVSIATPSITVAMISYEKWGYIVSPEMYANEVESTWLQLYGIYRKFLYSSDKIIIKYRTVIDTPLDNITITWTSTSTFTCVYDLSNYVVGNEVEIIKGTGGGKSAHISSSVYDSLTGTYTITLDDTFKGASGTASARFSKWIVVDKSPITALTIKQFKKLGLPINSNDTKIQFKICMQFTGDNELERFIVVDKPEVKIT